MSALAELQTQESYEAFHAGAKRKALTPEIAEYIVSNTYANKRQKVSENALQRGRYKYDQLGILRTKPG